MRVVICPVGGDGNGGGGEGGGGGPDEGIKITSVGIGPGQRSKREAGNEIEPDIGACPSIAIVAGKPVRLMLWDPISL